MSAAASSAAGGANANGGQRTRPSLPVTRALLASIKTTWLARSAHAPQSSSHARFALALHAAITSAGFALVQAGPRASRTARTGLPASSVDDTAQDVAREWDALEGGEFAFVYKAPDEWSNESAHVLVRCVPAPEEAGENESVIVARAVRVDESANESAIVAQRRVVVPTTPPDAGLEELAMEEATALLDGAMPEQTQRRHTTTANAGSAGNNDTDEPRTTTVPQPAPTPYDERPPPYGVGDPRFRPQPWAGVGADDLDPFGGIPPPGFAPGMPGNVVGPNHPIFGGAPGLPPGYAPLPPGVPPGARFDPYGPTGMPGFGQPPPPGFPSFPGRGRGRGVGGVPDPDRGEPPVHPDVQYRPPPDGGDLFNQFM